MNRTTKNQKLKTKNLRIAIDCRFWGLEHTGLGRYTMRLVEELMHLDYHNEYYLLLRKTVYDQLHANSPLSRAVLNSPLERGPRNEEGCVTAEGGVLPPNFHPILAEARHYTIKEQLVLSKIIFQLKPDIYHAPHFNIPVFLPIVSPSTKLITTIHDLIKHSSVGSDTTTLPMPIYWFKLAVYRWVFNQALNRSQAIIVPSNFSKKELTTHYLIPATKVHVTYEAPNDIYYQKSKNYSFNKLLHNYQISKPFLIYTGNAYPHKNLPNLISALKIFNDILKPQNLETLKLAIVCARNVFRVRVEEYVKRTGTHDYVQFLGFVPDSDLRELYRNSIAFITPSLLEGFGLSGLEAMAAGTPVISSNASCLPEIYGPHAIYFDPHNPQDIADKILQTQNLKPTERHNIIQKGIKHSQTFSWTAMARQTLNIYQEINLNS